ncbi:MAG: ABC transporter ATP-binding protein [Betaproteobacteria bacterium]|nr:ABC transporter ATP-binding protein [Betaproteobacteria bacterium]
MLELRSLSAGYGDSTVVRRIDLRVGAGEIVALVGANGAGKSTLVKTISGLVAPRAGEIVFEGQSIGSLSPRARVQRGIVHVPEGRQVFAGLSIAENLRLGAWAHRAGSESAAIAQRMRSLSEQFPVLAQRLAEPAGTLSGGQQQMLAIARGLMAEPRLLLLDEPSLGLAPLLVMETFRLIQSLRDRGMSILLAEQNARLSLGIADRGYVIETGRVALAGTGRELLDKPEVAARYLGVGSALDSRSDARAEELAQRLARALGTQ